MTNTDTTPDFADQIPLDFTLESLATSTLSKAEIDAMTSGDDPVFATPPAEAQASAAPPEPMAAPTPAPAPQATPQPQLPDTTQAEAIIAKVDADLEALALKYDDGELTRAEWMAQQKALVQQQAAAQVTIEKAQSIVTDVRTQRLETFNGLLNAYKAQPDNAILWSQEHIGGWDAALRAVTGNPAYADLPLDRQISLAHDFYSANVKAMTGNALPRARVEAGTATPAAPAAKPGPRQEPRPEPVQTLAALNGDTAASITDGTFAAIDRQAEVSPFTAEEMFARMTPQQQRDYLGV